MMTMPVHSKKVDRSLIMSKQIDFANVERLGKHNATVKKEMKTYFADDKYEAVHDALAREGWRRVFDPSLPCDLMWTNLKSITFDNRAFKVVNHFPGSQVFSNKV